MNTNSQELVSTKFKELKEEISCLKYGGDVRDSNHEIQGEILQSWDEVVEDEYSHDKILLFDWNFFSEWSNQ